MPSREVARPDMLRRLGIALLLTGAIAGCAKNAQAPSASQSSPSSAATTGPTGSQPTQSMQPQAGESSTGTVDVLLSRHGTILRSWPATSLESAPENTLLGTPGWTAKEGASGPYEFVYELAGLATIQQFVVPDGGDSANLPPAIHFAVSTASATSGFNDVGTIHPNASNEQDLSVSPPIKARWIKITVDQRGSSTQLYDIQAMGTFDPRPSAATNLPRRPAP